MEINMEFHQMIKNRTTILSLNCTPGYLSEEKENTNLKRYMHLNIHSSIIHSNQEMKAT